MNLFLFLVALAEFLDSPRRIHEHGFPGIERVGCMGNLHLYQRIFLSIFPNCSLFRGGSRAGQKRIVIGHIFEYNQAVIFGMNVLFH